MVPHLQVMATVLLHMQCLCLALVDLPHVVLVAAKEICVEVRQSLHGCTML